MTLLSPTPAKRACGCLLGLAIGEALAAPVSGLKAGRIQQLFGEVSDYIDARAAWEDRPHRWRLPGLHGDKTQQAMAVAIVASKAHEHFDPAVVSNLWRRMAYEPREAGLFFGAFRGAGGTFRRALESAKTGGNGMSHPSAGSGAAARVAALGLVLEGADEISRAASEVALLTHSDPRAIAATVAVAQGVSLLYRAEDPLRIDTRTFFESLIQRVRSAEERLLIDHLGRLHLDREVAPDPVHAMSRALDGVAALVAEHDDDLALRTLVRQANHLGPAQPITSPASGFAPALVPTAFYFALAHQRFAAPLQRIVNEGRDADTLAAITGALLGVRLGEDGIPADWKAGLLARDQISAVAEALVCGLAQPQVNPTSFIANEVEWTLRENAARAPLLAEHSKQRAREEKRAAAYPKSVKPKPTPDKALPFAPPPQTYLREDDPMTKQRERAARGRKRIDWKDDRRRERRG